MGKRLHYVEAEEVRRDRVTAFREGKSIALLEEEVERSYYRQYIDFYYRTGYDFFPDARPYRYMNAMMMPKTRVAKDTAPLPRKGGYYDGGMETGFREWADEGVGVIASWKDFETFPWDRMRLHLDTHYDFLSKTVPHGMKAMAFGSLYEPVLERLLGFEGLFYLLYDDPELVKQVTERWARILGDFYEDAIERDVVGGIFHGDDLGYKTGTMVSPSVLRKMFLPWS